MTAQEKLEQVAEKIVGSGLPERESVRTLLSWFGHQRRGRRVVNEIRAGLKDAGLTTDPDFETAYIDSTVELKRTPSGVTLDGPVSGVTEDEELTEVRDPVARIRTLEAANRAPVSVSRDQPVSRAETLMMLNDFSQLPVVTGDGRSVDGMISWRSIGTARALNNSCAAVRECMERVVVVEADDPLLEVIPKIIEHEVVLVQERDRKIVGLVTTSDVSRQFKELAEPFLLVGEIEKHLRRLIDDHFSPEEIERVRDPDDEERQVAGVDDLTFGEYARLLEDPGNWGRISTSLDRKAVIKRMHRVREIRNDVMHFTPDGILDSDVECLRDTVRFFQRLH